MIENPATQINVAKLRDLILSGVDLELIDVHEPWEFEICNIPKSRSIPLSELHERADELATDKTTILICHHGSRSYRATSWLRQSGFEKALNLSGGVDAWAREIEPNMARY